MDRLHQRVIHRLVSIFAGLVLFFVGLANIVRLSGRPDWMRVILQRFIAADFPVGTQDYQWWVLLWWVLVAMLPVFLLGLFLTRILVRQSTLTLRSESGYSLRIRDKAVRRYVLDRLRSLDFVEKASVTTCARGKDLRLQTFVSVATDQPLVQVQREIEEDLTGYVKRGLGIERVKLQVEFVELKPRSPQPEPEPEPEPEAEMDLETKAAALATPMEDSVTMAAGLPLLTPVAPSPAVDKPAEEGKKGKGDIWPKFWGGKDAEQQDEKEEDEEAEKAEEGKDDDKRR